MHLERTLAASLLVLAGALPVSAAGEEDLEALVRRQGAQIAQLQEEVGRLRSRRAPGLEDDISQYLVATETERELPPASKGSRLFGGRVRVGGYFSLEFRDDGDGVTTRFDQHRLVLKLQSDIAEGIGFETEIEIEGGGADVPFLTGNEILVEYAELSFELIEDKLVFVAGVILMPWGRFNEYHDDPLNNFTDRPLVSRRIGAVAFGQPGIGVQGTLEFANAWFLDYDVALVQGFAEGFTTNGGVRGARQSYRADNNDNKQVFGRFVISPPVQFVDVLEGGASFTYGKYDDGGSLADYGYGLDLFVKKGPVELVGEYMMLRIEQPGSAPLTDPRRMDGWYVEVAYHFFPVRWRGKHILFTEESTLTLVVRVEGIDLNHSTTGSTFRDDLNQVSFGFNFRPVQRSVMKISYTWVDSEETGLASGAADRFTISWASYF
ncbi:MAG: hypothetical protein ACYTEZ_14465 [Planctomycetota bacterium]|jgi:hypothetical protein